MATKRAKVDEQVTNDLVTKEVTTQSLGNWSGHYWRHCQAADHFPAKPCDSWRHEIDLDGQATGVLVQLPGIRLLNKHVVISY